jgi:predicted TPR repeat methyltransferase
MNWEQNAKCYDTGRSIWPLERILKAEYRRVALMLDRVYRPGSRWLDVGCGTGTLGEYLGESVRLTGIDRSLHMARCAILRPYRHIVVADLNHLPVSSSRMDGILMIGVMEYCGDVYQSMHSVLDRIVPRGYLIASVSPPGWFTQMRRILDPSVVVHAETTLEAWVSTGAVSVVARSRLFSQHLYCFQKQ